MLSCRFGQFRALSKLNTDPVVLSFRSVRGVVKTKHWPCCPVVSVSSERCRRWTQALLSYPGGQFKTLSKLNIDPVVLSSQSVQSFVEIKHWPCCPVISVSSERCRNETLTLLSCRFSQFRALPKMNTGPAVLSWGSVQSVAENEHWVSCLVLQVPLLQLCKKKPHKNKQTKKKNTEMSSCSFSHCCSCCCCSPSFLYCM